MSDRNNNIAFWKAMADLVSESSVIIDRPKDTPHPRYPEVVYPLDYGYIENTTSSDGGGIDVWLGSLNSDQQHKEREILTGILCTFDTLKRDAEIKLLIGCTQEEIEIILNFHSEMHILFIPNPKAKMNFPEQFLDLLNDDSKALLYLATIMPDGSPQVTPVWFDTDGEHILINTNEQRVKDKNMRVRPKVAMTIQDPNDMYRYLGVRGEVVSYTTEGADEHINKLSLKYDNEPWTYRETQKRIIFKIKPTHFDEHN